MYIVLPSLKKTLGKWIELEDLFVGLPILFIFLILFSFTPFKAFSIGFLTLGGLLMLPVNVSKKNRMYKVFILLFQYFKRKRNYILIKEERKEQSNGTNRIIKQVKSKIGLY